jgi:hypothetical protein
MRRTLAMRRTASEKLRAEVAHLQSETDRILERVDAIRSQRRARAHESTRFAEVRDTGERIHLEAQRLTAS